VQNTDGSAINPFTVAYVPAFVGEHSFQNFDPHISLGVAPKEVLDSLAQHVFKPKPFKPASLCVYQLGVHGTAQRLLWQAD